MVEESRFWGVSAYALTPQNLDTSLGILNLSYAKEKI